MNVDSIITPIPPYRKILCEPEAPKILSPLVQIISDRILSDAIDISIVLLSIDKQLVKTPIKCKEHFYI